MHVGSERNKFKGDAKAGGLTDCRRKLLHQRWEGHTQEFIATQNNSTYKRANLEAPLSHCSPHHPHCLPSSPCTASLLGHFLPPNAKHSSTMPFSPIPFSTRTSSPDMVLLPSSFSSKLHAEDPQISVSSHGLPPK